MAEVKAPPLDPKLIQQAEFTRNTWSITVPPRVPFQSVMAPEFWTHVTRRIKQYDHIEIRAQDNAWWAHLMVAKVEDLAAHMWVLNHAALSIQTMEAAAPDAKDYVVRHGGPNHQWRIIRLSDKAVIHHGEPTEEDAKKWLADFVAGRVSA